MKKLVINLTHTSYNIYIGKKVLANLGKYIKDVYNNKKIYIITDTNVEKLYLADVCNALKEYEVYSYAIKAGEESKNITSYQEIINYLLAKEIRRNDLILALGGGVVGDLAGFVAATLYRGLPFINIPTSLLSQMDSSIGGKTGIDYYNRKNVIGAFKQPDLVLIDPSTLSTLDKREFNNGMGELIKHALIGNSKLFTKLLTKPEIDEEIIYESLLVKKKYVEEDEFDKGNRMILNFGHTFGHAIELNSDYKHGECVAIGMMLAIKLGIELKITNSSLLADLKKILDLYELPYLDIDYHKLLHSIIYDKKNLAGVINFILIKDIGDPVIYKMKEEDIKSA